MRIRSPEFCRGRSVIHELGILALVASFGCLQVLAQSPANNMFDYRIPLAGATNSLTVTAFSTNTLATAEPFEPQHRGSPAVRSLWWDWWAPVDGYVLVSTTNSPSQTRVAVYDGSKQLSLLYTQALLNESGSPIAPDLYEFNAFSGLHYNIAVDGRNGDSGAIQLDLKVYTRPEILVQPPATNILTAGQRASLAVRALGKLPLTYQWQFSTNSPNAGFTNLTLGTSRVYDIGTFGVVSNADRGWYRVTSRNDYGAVTSSVTRIEVNECAMPNPPQPPAISTNVGNTVFFTASSLGTPPLAFQWQFQPTNQYEFVDLPGATSTNLVMTNISTDQEGLYRFLVSNIACTNQASATVSLSVSTIGAIVLNPNLPADQTVITNFNVTNLVRVLEGFQPIHYQWWFAPASGLTNMLVGETAPDLFLAGVQFSQAGSYWAVVTNRYATATSRVAQLNVELRPPNDNFANRIPIFPAWTNLSYTNISSATVTGSNKNATQESGEPHHQGHGPAISVWWSFTAPVDGRVLIDLSSGAAPPQLLAAYRGNALTNLVAVSAYTNTLTHFDFVATNNSEYVFAVDAQSGSNYSQSISLNLIFNPDIGAPIITRQPGGGGEIRDPDTGKTNRLGTNVLGGLPGAGCRTFNGFVVEATSLDGVVYYQWQRGSTTNDTDFANLLGMTNSMLVLPNVTTSDQGWYRAQVSNRSTTVAYTIPVYLMVNIGPAFLTDGQPSDVKTNACTAAMFQVKIESCSPLGYQWRQNGTNVSALNAQGRNTNTLIITNLTPANEGAYDAVIWNANLSITSQVATLTLTNTPVITAQPQPSTKHGCETNTFSVSTFANCALTYQWYFQGTNLLSGATQSTLSINGVQPSDAGDYFVMVSTPFASVPSQSARLTVQTDPVIIQAPSAVTNRECDIVNLQVLVGAEPSCSWLTYQWQLEGTNLPAATNRVYSFEAKAETAGNYQVVVGNRWTNRIAGPARVTVDVQPRVVQQPPSSLRIREGDAFTNAIIVQSCSAMSYQWLYKSPNGTNFSNLALDASHQVDTNGWLIVSNSQTNDSGYYRVIASNTYTGITSTVSLVRVVHPPGNDNIANAFSLGRTNQAFAIGYNEYATAEVGEPYHGLQPPNHSVWWVWTNPFPSLVTADLNGSDIDTLLGVYAGSVVSNLTTIAEDDNGGTNLRSRVSFMAGGGKVLYFAVDGKNNAEGTNLMLSVTTSPITSPPVITNQPLNLAATAGQTVTFTIRAYGSPDMSIQWFGKGTPRGSITTSYPPASPTNYLSTLTLTNVSTNDDGVYYVVLTNTFGAVTSKLATLTFGSIVRGLVTDATRTTPDGAAISLPGVLVSVGDVTNYTDENGNYELVGVKLGSLRADFMADKTHVHLGEKVQFWNRSTSTASLLTATTNGFYDYTDDQFEVGQGQTVAKRFAMSPVFDGLRFVLNWTNVPADLDLLLHFPPSVPVGYPWIDYLPTNRGSMTQPPYAIGDVDSANGWGPETISIHRFYPGTYSLYANKFQGQGGTPLAQSSARLVAYLGGDVVGPSPQLRPYGSLLVPTQGTNDWWHICDVDGATTNITWINELMATAPGESAGKSVAAGPLVGISQKGDIRPKDALPPDVDYEWNFGDGSLVSNKPEPSYAYTDPGWKTVSLKMTQRIGSPPKSNTVTRTNYIYVLNMPPVVAITNPAPGTIFRAGDPITLQSAVDGVDDPIAQVDYYLQNGAQLTKLGTATIAPYTLVIPNTNFLDSTNVFVALARDLHGATNWSAPVATVTIDLRGDILILRNSRSAEIDEMAIDLGALSIPDKDPYGNPFQRLPVVKVLDQEGLYFGLVKGFKLIIWNDQGQTAGGLTDNDVGVLKQAYDAGIALYLTGERLAQSREFLTDLARFQQWTELLGSQWIGSMPPPMHIHGIPIPDYQDGLYYGWYYQASTDILYSNVLERLSLTGTNMDVVADVPVAGAPTNSPIMLRYPRFSQPDFGETRRLIQDFRVTADQPPQSDEEVQSRQDRRILFINGVAWLLRMFECQDLSVNLECVQPLIPSGSVGVPMTFTTLVDQNGSCTAGGVLLTNNLSPRLRAVSAEVVPAWDGIPTNNYQVAVSSNFVVARFSQLQRNSFYEFRTVAIPTRGGWLTNTCTVTRGLSQQTPCAQVAFIEGPACTTAGLSARLDANNTLHLIVRNAAGCAFQLESSTDLKNWVDSLQVQPDADPYDVQIGPPFEVFRFYRLRKLE